MIKNTFLKKQISKAHSVSRTPNFLRRLTFLVVEEVLLEHYKDSFSMRCLQSSIAISHILSGFGIKNKIFTGDLCISQVFEDSYRSPSWNGFWGNDHHIWVCTEFDELIDLTVKFLHIHPNSLNNRQVQVPAIWWDDFTQWPSIIRYIPKGSVKLQLSKLEMDDIEEFKKLINIKLAALFENSSVSDIEFAPILEGENSMNELHVAGNDWLQKSIYLEKMNIPYPKAIQEKLYY